MDGWMDVGSQSDQLSMYGSTVCVEAGVHSWADGLESAKITVPVNKSKDLFK